jgi:hypothetical protein
MTLLAVLVPHLLIPARVLAATGQKGYALFHRVMAVYTALGLVVGLDCGSWLSSDASSEVTSEAGAANRRRPSVGPRA